MINRKWKLFDEWLEKCKAINPDAAIVEFGAGSGGTASGISENYEGQLFTVDWFSGLPKTERRAPSLWSQGAFKFDSRATTEKLNAYPQTTLINCDIFKLKDPEEYGIPPIVGVHIDVDIYESAIASLRYVDRLEWDRIAIRFDDWGDGVYLKHEPAALEEWLEESDHKEINRIVVNVGDNPGFGMRQCALVEVQRGVVEKRKTRKKARRKTVENRSVVEDKETAEDPPITDDESGLDPKETKAEEVATAPAAGSFEALWARVDTVGNPVMLSEATARTLADVLIEHQPKVAVEIGTHLGRSGALIASVIKEWGGKLTSYDPYNPRFLSTRQRQVLMGNRSGDEVAAEAEGNFRGIDLDVRMIRTESPKAAEDHENGSIDFLFFDADHMRTRDHVAAWLPKIAAGGVLVVDDANDPHVQKALFSNLMLEGEMAGTLFVYKVPSVE